MVLGVSTLSQLRVLAYVLLAMVLGAMIGIERETEDKPAGLRTHMLVAGASSLLVGVSDAVVRYFSSSLEGMLVRADPVRVIEAVVTGVSFLGAGTIIRRSTSGKAGSIVEGLTTAASILFTAAVGISAALGQIVLAIGATLLTLVTLRGVGALERWMDQHRRLD
jgi:putative Mg2+ transporter-C (MgtC) family protein